MINEANQYLQFEKLLRQRGIHAAGNESFDLDIVDQYEKDYAVLILDSSGFTRITAKYGIIHFLALTIRMQEIVNPLLTDHQVLESWAEADNLYGIFMTAKAAVQAALSIQEAINAENQKRPESDRLAVCIGIGFGPLLNVGEKHIYGQEMNFASKLGEDIASSGEILITKAAYEAMWHQVSGLNAIKFTLTVSSVSIEYYSIRAQGRVSWT
ncbi:adenylate/guanylate cyclase domain-containing protein [candidate division CSSED10-310 bacterium]|uniref:Adenylate/guanylate cyclase domain-containing protein n=1 Tax=candidate division CSSED10-310 bacterium TaxID=2855610 RepID=A0ABV6Z5K2_UNCC1